MRLAIFGCGGMGRETADLAVRAALVTPENMVFVTDEPGPALQGIDRITPDALRRDDEMVVALGDPTLRRRVAERFAERRFATLIARSAIVSSHARIGPGTILCEGAMVNNSASVGRHAIINVLSHVSHDCRLGDFITLSPGVSCNGWVEIGDGAFLGAHAVIRNGEPGRRIRIGARAIVAAGATVVRDVAPDSTVRGTPAR